ncbi:putative non-specific serine/threonine protein kinase [Lupinus albus]|uniref:Putative non-specific serine/threonine protein kinase n=1 Tax=Lupinus albus TaxID=3870 RepID=A0A6A4NFV1_LUPAL|nr:putative non-specific serine/threonine protein kinase [Lupinus albus]
MSIIIMMNPASSKFIQAIFLMLLMWQVEFVCAEEVRCIESERQVLLNFKASLVDTDGKLCLSTWRAEEDKRECCQWKGVGCSNQTSHVEILDIGGCYLTVTMTLVYLDLSKNDIVGSLPSQLGNLSNLKLLDLSFNGLEGTLPSQLGKLSSLLTLFLGFNYLKFDNENHMGGQWLSNLTSLSHLDLSEMSNLNNSNTWLQMIGKLPKLTQLVLQSCSLSEDFFLSLDPSKLTFPTSLTVIDLSLNPVKSSVMKFLMNICTLRSLIMHDTNLSEELSTFFHHLSIGCIRYSLQELHLDYNQITGTLPDLSILPSLKILRLDSNRLSGKIPDTIKLPSYFESLDVESNSLEGGIPKSFGNACTLSSLILSDNSLSEELTLIIHHLSGCARHTLQELYLDFNKINDTIPDLSTFSSLKVLYLSENRLNGKIPENIPFPPQLEILQMGGNSLEGVITDYYFANMSKLKSLVLSNNPLNLIFSQNWVPSFQLDTIQLRSCKLGPSFPKWLQTQFNLEDLDISNVGISDNVPEWFWPIATNLYSMNISYNNLTGIIPNFPLRPFTFPSIILAANQFEGSIPPNLRSAWYLDLSKNKFSDSSLFICANGIDKSLGLLDLSYNRLSGKIPDCWNNFKSLGYLDLSNNNLSGEVPSTIGSTLELRALILRNNSLIGNLPSSLMSCTKLLMLDVGENKLSGVIPFWIGSTLQHLKMLSLRRNHFSEKLPLSLCYLSNIYLLDLSSNNLNGQIPKCFNNFSAMAKEGFSSHDAIHITEANFEFHGTLISYFAYYDLIAFLMWKGVESIFKNNNLLLKGIDLSSNQLTNEIPSEIEDLVGLVSLNLSRNNLSGKIPLRIGRLTSLEFLDLSRNHLSGSIPSSLTQIDRLTMLDLSHNHLSGKIPTGTQLQSFNASNYEDNLNLCGMPLQKLCTEEEPSKEPLGKFDEDEDSIFGHGFYISMAIGFVIGFWGVIGPILVSRSWRHAYFRFFNNLSDDIYVRIAITVAKWKLWLKH